MKLKILVLDNNKVFLKRLKRAFDEFYKEEIEWIDIDNLNLKNINKSNCDILLVDKFYDISGFVSLNELAVAFLTPDFNEVKDYCIFKYSRAKEIYKKLNEIYYRYTENKDPLGQNEAIPFFPNTISEEKQEENLYLNSNIIPEVQQPTEDLHLAQDTMAVPQPMGDLYSDPSVTSEQESMANLYLEPNVLPEQEPITDLYLEPNVLPEQQPMVDLYLEPNVLPEQEPIADLYLEPNVLPEQEPITDLYLEPNVLPEQQPMTNLYLDPSVLLPEQEPMADLSLDSNAIPAIQPPEEPYFDANTKSELNSNPTDEIPEPEYKEPSAFGTFDMEPINFNKAVCKLFMSLPKSGATSVAIAKVGNLLEQGYKVLYLNLETLPSTENFFKKLDFEEEKIPLEFSYENIADYLSSVMVCRNNSLYYLLPFKGQACEMISTVTGMKLLLDTLLNMKLFDYIIIDFTTCLDERLKLLYQYCESITLITKGDFIMEQDYKQVEDWLIENSLFDKCRCLFNQLISENTFDTKMNAIGAIPKFYEEEGMKLVNRILKLGIINEI